MAAGITPTGLVHESPDLSIVVPVYGCVACLRALSQRVSDALGADGTDWELIFVDDESPDESWRVLEELSQADDRIRALRLSRNFGQHAAITAGLAEARGRRVAVMDCDLQDPPEELPRLLATARDGWDIVLTKRDQRRQAWHRRAGARAYFRARNRLLGLEVDPEYSTLSVISRSVVDAYLRLGDRDRQYMLILHWLGFRRTVLSLQHSERFEGRSSYTLSGLIKVALDGMFFQTTVLLRWIIYLGFAVALAGVGLAAALVVLYFVNRPLPGFTSLAVLILLVGGFIILSTGITGLYVGKIFEQVKGRPLYVVAEQTQPRSEYASPEAHSLGAERRS
jgi:glycosyltransferase involved in cell wall biosynthesis